MRNVCAVVLAAGDGKRMKSAYPKVLCEVLFKPMISWVVDSARGAGIEKGCVVLGENAGLVEKLLPGGFATVLQNERRGTGHAVMMAADYIQNGGFEDVVVLCGDAPFISPQELQKAYSQHKDDENALTVLAAQVENPFGYGRIVREGAALKAVVEQADADAETLRIDEVNSGAFWFRADFLLEALGRLSCDNAQGEYYLPDTIRYALQTGRKAGACSVGPDAVLGANDRKTLSALNRIALEKVLDRHLSNGVDIPFFDGIVVGTDVKIGADTRLLPGTILRGRTVIGKNCEIGPNSYLDNATVADNCRVISTYIDRSTLENGTKIGPMSNIRPDCHVGSGVKVGDFVELKNSIVGANTSVAHLTYLGDTDIGCGCNVGCGVVTVNYDGTNKFRTVIGNDVFIGCNTNLVAPVKMGNRSYSAAGTTVTEDVPDDALVIGRAKQSVKIDWSNRTGKFAKKK